MFFSPSPFSWLSRNSVTIHPISACHLPPLFFLTNSCSNCGQRESSLLGYLIFGFASKKHKLFWLIWGRWQQSDFFQQEGVSLTAATVIRERKPVSFFWFGNNVRICRWLSGLRSVRFIEIVFRVLRCRLGSRPPAKGFSASKIFCVEIQNNLGKCGLTVRLISQNFKGTCRFFPQPKF